MRANLEDDDERSWEATIGWMFKRGREVESTDLEWTWREYLRLHPSSRSASGVRQRLAFCVLGQSSREERTRVYREAVDKGSTKLAEGVKLGRATALQMAAYDGIEELEDEIRTHADELLALWKTTEEVDAFVETMRFRSGAATRDEAERQHADRIRRLSAAEVEKRARDSGGFRRSTASLAATVCYRAGSKGEPCSWMRDVLREQRELEKTESAPERDELARWRNRLAHAIEHTQEFFWN